MASRTVGEEAIVCSVQTGHAVSEAGRHPASGGDGLSLCSVDMSLEAIRLSFELHGHESAERSEQLIHLTARDCVVFETLRHTRELVVARCGAGE